MASLCMARFSTLSDIVEPTDFENETVSKLLTCIENSEKASTKCGSTELEVSSNDASSTDPQLTPRSVRFSHEVILPSGPVPQAGKEFHTRLFQKGEAIIKRMTEMGFGPNPVNETEENDQTAVPSPPANPMSWLDQGLCNKQNVEAEVSSQALRSI